MSDTHNIVHYMHFNKLWYYWLDNYTGKKYYRKLEEKCSDVNLLSGEIITEGQCRKILRNLFPQYKIMKAFPYHYSSSSWGSRPTKSTVDRKSMLKEKIRFKKELDNMLGE